MYNDAQVIIERTVLYNIPYKLLSVVPYGILRGSLASHTNVSITKECFLFSDNLFALFNNL